MTEKKEATKEWGEFVLPSEETLKQSVVWTTDNRGCICLCRPCQHSTASNALGFAHLARRKNVDPVLLDIDAFPIVSSAEVKARVKEEQEKNVTAIPAYNRTETTMVATKSKYEYSEFPNSIVYSTRLRGYDTAEAFELPNDLAARFNSVVLYINGLVISRDAPRSGWQRIGPTKPPIFLNSLAYVQVELLLLTTDETLPASFDINTRVGIFCSSVRNDICTMEFRVPMIRRPSTAIINQRWFLAYGGGCAGVAFDQIPDGFGKYNPVWDTMMEAFDKGDYKGFIQKGRDAGGLMIPADRLIGFFLGQVMNREIFDERPDKTFEVVVTTVLDKFDDAVVDKRAFADWVLLDALKHPSVAHLVPRLEKVCTPGQVDKYRVALADDKKTETKVAEDNP